MRICIYTCCVVFYSERSSFLPIIMTLNFIKHLLRAKHWAKHSLLIFLCNPHNNAMGHYYSQHYYSVVIPVLPINAIRVKLSSVYKVTFLVVSEAQTGKPGLIETKTSAALHYQGK